MNYFVTKLDNGFGTINSQWNECVRFGVKDRFFLRHEWFENYINEVRNYQELLVVGLYINEEIKGYFPGCIKKQHVHRLPFRSLSFISNYYSPYCAPVVKIDAGSDLHSTYLDLIQGVIENNNRWDIIMLEDLPDEHGEYSNMKCALQEAGLSLVDYDTSYNWYLKCKGMGYEDFLASRGRRRRETWRRKRRKLETRDDITVEIVKTPGESLEMAIRDYYAIYAGSWKIPEPFPNFHKKFMRIAAENGWLRLGVIRIDSIPVAAQLWIVYNGVASIVKLAYDENYKKLSPGTVLTLVLMEHVLNDEEVEEVDFLSGNDPYKKDWMSDCRFRRTILAYNNKTIKGKFLQFFDQNIYPLLKIINSTFGGVKKHQLPLG